MKRRPVLALILPLLLSACAMTQQAESSSDEPARVDAARDRAPIVIMDASEAQRYALSLFSDIYFYGGYTWHTKPYAPGEFTQWSARNLDLGQFFEKALLERRTDGSEWWRIRAERKQGTRPVEFVFEALLTAPDAEGAQHILKLRCKLPGESTGHDIPLAESSLTLKPTAHLTHLNLEWGTIGWEAVKVPAGLFRARHIRYKGAPGKPEWWLSHEVPGGVIQYSIPDPDGRALGNSEVELVKAGSGALSMIP